MAGNLELSLKITPHMDRAEAALKSIRESLADLGNAGNSAAAKMATAFDKTENQFSKTRQGVQSISQQLGRLHAELLAFFSLSAGGTNGVGTNGVRLDIFALPSYIGS